MDGDYWESNQSKVWDYGNHALTSMAKIAQSKNMVFVPVVSPDKNKAGDGITWWESADAHGDWLRGFANWFQNTHGIDRSNVSVLGYSGGAEFITLELNADRQESWRTGGGSIIVGDGTPRGQQTTTSARFKALPLDFYVGNRDGKGATWPATWSAWGAAHAGATSYRAAGFSNVEVNVVNGDHYQYDFAGYLAESFREANASRPTMTVHKTAISECYAAGGGGSRFGQPTSGEIPIRDGGYAQRFGAHYTIYWHESVGAAPVNFAGGIGSCYAVEGFENGLRFPTGAEHGLLGGTVQKFTMLGRGTNALYWSADHQRVHKVWEHGAIGARFTSGRATARYGFPTTDEFALSAGGYAQKFRLNNGYESLFVWSAQAGVKIINANGGLYWYWKNRGYTSTFGLPISDEVAHADGRVTLDFSKGYRLTWFPNGKITQSRI
ncbi:LGFP repeat-containing protein [Rothia sp. ZJ932]|uniref:LGFP repeat-containing protein n=1 Tax=Rothia sp. ZJ932 TaxID=2810516 RepID=UPI001966EB2A|nr:hypothetical protein [Rothia sp. ZJ932]QRZ62380.1 hypothetical protein JR346_04645 [Rothia sp. ZJ932]